jgi:predicted NACHT family NTPase
VKEVREKVKPDIQERCGTMRVLDMPQPIELNDIYTNVNILEQITGRRRKEIAELLQEFNSNNFEYFGLRRSPEELLPGLDAVKKHPKLIVLGKQGAGKTTFLKYLAIQCIEGKFQAERVPIFVTLKDFAQALRKLRLLEYISQQFVDCEVVREDTTSLSEELLRHGRGLVLLDGLDEVREEDKNRVFKEIRDFSDRFRDNHFVMTCRIAAVEYTFEKFTELELADFNDEQVSNFAKNWFKNKTVKSETFVKHLEGNKWIKQLTTSPLLLTLLCLAFEESGYFPENRSDLCKEGVDLLLKKWDAKRGIHRNPVYKKLSPQRKEDLLSKIALITFERDKYFFKQKAVEQYIIDYIRNLPDANTDLEELQLDSEKILNSIEAQHGLLVEQAKGIYSFSHLLFHKYFAAREIVFGKQSSQEVFQKLVSHVIDKRWWEVFLLAVEMSLSADHLLLLMKQQVDAMVTNNQKIQQFLMWVNQKSVSVKIPYNPLGVRAFYFEYALTDYLAYNLSFFSLADYLGFNSISIPTINLEIDLTPTVDSDLAFVRYDIVELNLCIDYALDCDLEPRLKQALQQFKTQLPDSTDDKELLDQWWEANRLACAEQLRDLMIKYRNIGHDWQFSNQQKEVLKQYRDANKFLMECLNSDCYVSREVRSQIEDTLLLPITEIEKKKQR